MKKNPFDGLTPLEAGKGVHEIYQLAAEGYVPDTVRSIKMTDYTDPESPVADPHVMERLMYKPALARNAIAPGGCLNCGLYKTNHINDLYCPEWRLRQLDGDR